MVSRTLKRIAAVVQSQSPVILAAYLIVLLAATHYPQTVINSTGPLGLDKLVHMIAYAVVGCLIAIWRHRGSRNPTTQAVLIGVLLAALIGAADEITQPWFNRVADPLDWAADLAGALTGYMLYLWLRRLGLFSDAT